MRREMNTQIEINAAAEKVWRILAHEFENVSQWATVIEESEAITDSPAPAGAQVCGRTCSAKGFGQVMEKFTHYDEESMTFGYAAIQGLPRFMKSAENNFSVHSWGPNKCLVESRAEIEWSFPLGLLLAPLSKFQMARSIKNTFEELKYYAEHDQPHPRKLRATGGHRFAHG